MRKLLTLLLFTFGAAAVSSAQNSPVSNNDNALLWQISGNGLKTPSYIFGTYHLTSHKFIDSLGYIEAKFRACKTIVSEEVIDRTNTTKVMPVVMLQNTSLDKLFSPAEYKMIADTLNKVLQVNLDQLKTLKPAGLEMVITVMLSSRYETPPDSLIDTYFQVEGKKLNDKIIGLETAEFQDSLVFNMDIETQKRHLLYVVKHINEQRADAQRSYNLYTHQDLQKSFELQNNDGYSQEEHDAMLKNRNLKWMQQLPDIMATNSAFIAVGVSHLVGQYGLVNQLRLKGYTVTPVMQ